MIKGVSFDLYAEKGFLKKPDINDGLYLTYNVLHRPCVLGILGAMVGLDGFQENGVFPEYYQQLKNIPIGIKPLCEGAFSGFEKEIIKYNNTTGFASKEEGGNLIITEQTLIAPSFRVYLQLDLDRDVEKRLYECIVNQQSEYIPYLGKNDYSLWWDKDEVMVYDECRLYDGTDAFVIDSIFEKRNAVVNNVVEKRIGRKSKIDFSGGSSFMFFEDLPKGYNKELYQYDYGEFVYTDWKLSSDSVIDNLYWLDDCIVQMN